MPRTALPHPLTDAEIKAKSGKTWDQWFKALDEFGGPAKGRRELGNLLQGEHKLDAWLSSTIVVEYEAARNIVEKDGRTKGYMICATKSMSSPAQKAFDAWASPASWNNWFSKGSKFEFKEGARYATADGDAGEFKKIRPGKAIKFTWENPKHTAGTMVEVTFQPKPGGGGRRQVHRHGRARPHPDPRRGRRPARGLGAGARHAEAQFRDQEVAHPPRREGESA